MKPIFDIDDGDFLFEAFGNITYDSCGNMMMRIGDNMAMDMEDGELHFVSDWNLSLFDDDDIQQSIPEYKNEIKKDKQELATDVKKKVLLATKEERHDDEEPLVSRVFEDELDRLFDIGYIQGPYKIYIEPEIAKMCKNIIRFFY